MRKGIIIIVLILPIALLAGCWDERLYKDLTSVTLIGVDGHIGELKGYYAASNNPNDPTKFALIEGEGRTPKEVRDNANLKLSRTLDLSELATILYSEDTAKEYLPNLLDALYRNSVYPISAKVAITKGDARKFVEAKNTKLPGEIGETYQKYLRSFELVSIFPKGMDLQRLASIFFEEGRDAALPYLEFNEQLGLPIVKGLALLHNRKFTGTTLNVRDSMVLVLLTDGVAKSATMSFLLEEHGKKSPISIDIIKLKKKIKIEKKGEGGIVHINTNFKVNVSEFPLETMMKKNRSKEIEKFLEREIKKNIMHMVKKCQEAQSDALGIGRIVRAHYPYMWNDGHWKETYAKLEFKTNVQVEIIRTGILR